MSDAHDSRLTARDWLDLSAAAIPVPFFIQFPFLTAPPFVRMFEDFGTQLPPLTALVLTTWFPLLIAALAASALVAAVALRRSRRTKSLLLGTSFLISALSFALILCAWYQPTFIGDLPSV